MTEWLLSLVPTYGLWLIGLTTMASCLALPIPASVVMLAAGGFAASGDLVIWQVIAIAILGAVAGDQVGFVVGRVGGAPLIDRLSRKPKRADIVGKARTALEQRGGIAIFLSRWLFSPLGPYVNFLAGAMRNNWAKFTVWGVAGEIVWCLIYVLMGHSFAGNLSAASDMLGSILGLMATGTAVLGLGWWLWRQMKKDDHAHRGLSELED